ncbi:NAD-dependent epimerase/dehydratase family protein [Myroides pelagicus]|uniref:NAD-dependent epimerase/dehydratase family protein n=1 Tax=Myroides pelagicus TaxID=270914 RepID=UPI002DB71C4E|nr:NAD-dependent epimerase/dehydratase family protein [Myroides pelagicus]MEC4113059.1 NAD-dependent epimerase/dehydratase family protein [Myroides pelagicus]
MKLVTGATGMVGANLVLKLLEQNTKIRAIYRNEDSINKTLSFFKYKEKETLFYKIEWVKADLCDIPALESAFEGIQEVYHCAALVSFDPNDERKLRQTNIEGTANMVNLSIAYGINKFCHVSSIAALGETLSPDKTIDEKTNWNLELYHSDYAITKYGAEMEVWRGTQEGLKAIIVNPGIIFGAGFRYEGSNEFFRKIEKDFPFYTKGLTGIIAVEDVVEIMVQLMQNDQYNEKFVLVSENLTYQELLTYIAEQMNKKPPYIYANPLGSKIAWRLDAFIAFITRKKRSFTKALAISSHTTYTYKSTKVKKTLAFTFTPYTTYIPKIVRYHRSNK